MSVQLPPILLTKSNIISARSRSDFDAYLPDLIAKAQHHPQVFAPQGFAPQIFAPQGFALVMLELDHFKSVNDAFGHLRGDAAIREFAARIQAVLRPQDQLFRYGGDEFVLILPQTDQPTAQTLAQGVLEQVKQRPFAGDPPLTISVSGGMAMFPTDAHTDEELFACADRRCRRAKQTARGQLVVDDDQWVEDEGLLQAPSRLLERDQELEKLHRFLDNIAHNAVNILQITGRAGVGKKRFMAEAREAARLHGFATLEVHGRPGLPTRVFGALADASLGWRKVLVPEAGSAAFAHGLRHIVEVSAQQGMVITLENLAEIDRASLEFLRDLCLTGGMEHLALIYAEGDAAAGEVLGTEFTATAHIELAPLSRQGVQVWLRHSLHWEAPADLVEWLFQHTGGLPARIKEVLKQLVESEQLRRHTIGWSYSSPLRIPPANRSTPPVHLPRQAANFIGRESQLRALHELLHKKSLLTIVGPGGIGKTRLAIQVASEEAGAFPDGIFFVALAALATQEDLLIALTVALQMPLHSHEDAKTPLFHHLQDKRALLIFDHLAQRHNAEGLLGDLIKAAPQLTLLITTRDQFDLPYQALLELSGLAYPESTDEAQIERYEAVQFFLQATHQAELAANLDQDSKRRIVQICQLLAGVPLALELAASFTQGMALGEIAAGLEQSLVSFATAQANQRRGLSLHYHSLLTVFDAFWQSLSATEQEILGRLAVFHGGFTAHAAHAVAGASSFFLNALAARSYLQRTSQQRYAMPELLRQYSLEWLAPTHYADAHNKHCHYYAAYAAAAEARMTTQPAVASEFGQELENIRTAWRWAMEQPHPIALQQICGGLAHFYLLRGRTREAKTTLQVGLAEIAKHPTEKSTLYAEGWSHLLHELDPPHAPVVAGYFEPVYT